MPHKGIRNAFSQLIHLAGKTDYNDRRQVEKLYNLGKETFHFLHCHARDENEVTLAALEARAPGASAHDMEDHERIEARQLDLEQALEEIHNTAQQGGLSAKVSWFYGSLLDFWSDYLKHMAEEETVTQHLLWKHFSDEELAEHRRQIIGRLEPETLVMMLKYIAPALAPAERHGLLKGMKMNAPGPFFEAVNSELQKVLDEEERKSLAQALQ